MLTHKRISDLCFLVDDLERSIAFYRDRAGFILRRQAPGFADFHTQGTTLALWERSHMVEQVGLSPMAADTRAWKTMAAVDLGSPDEVMHCYEALCLRGIEFAAPPRSYPWNAFACYFMDPDENLWELYAWQEGGHHNLIYESALPEAAP